MSTSHTGNAADSPRRNQATGRERLERRTRLEETARREARGVGGRSFSAVTAASCRERFSDYKARRRVHSGRE